MLEVQVSAGWEKDPWAGLAMGQECWAEERHRARMGDLGSH